MSIEVCNYNLLYNSMIFLVSFGLPSRILNLFQTTWALVYFLVSSLFLATCARLS